MPRILPRLVQELTAQANSLKCFTSPSLQSRKKPKSLYKPVPPAPSFNPADYPDVSLLLTPQNPVSNAKDYVRHKKMPPKPKAIDNSLKDDAPRRMTEQEFGWWANPYLRMLTSPLRKCAVTGRHLPADLLVRLVPLRVPASALHDKRPSSQTATVLVPDGLLHPKYAARQRSGGAVYTLCWRHTLAQAAEKGFHSPSAPGVLASPRVYEHTAHLLRLRVLQELELLAEKIENAVRCRIDHGNSVEILCLLTEDEWALAASTGDLPYDNAAAILVVPPVTEDPLTKARPASNMSTLPPDDDEYPTDRPPVSTFLPTKSNSWTDDLPKTMSPRKVPVYNGISAFPSRSQRATIRTLLLRILNAERSYKLIDFKSRPSSSTTLQQVSISSDINHTFLLCSDAFTAMQGDTAAIAIALWRLRMYEGEGWLDM